MDRLWHHGPLGLGYFIWAELKERRRVRREEAELADGSASSQQTGDSQDEETDSDTVGALRTTDRKSVV